MTKFWFFAANFMLLIAGVFFIKNQEEKKLVSEKVEITENIDPISSDILKTQESILQDREQKLRDAKTKSKQIKQIDTATTTTTTTPSTTSSSSSTPKTSTQTKTS